MGKIHTHYDNLKVARLAPQEVIRAAYKALSQKYHPDKNPGDEKAARIMAILNSAYGTLADPQRRKEHDEWIAAEEWEIEWLESTHQEEGRGKQRHGQADEAEESVAAPPYRAWRDWKWWLSLALCLALGWLAAALTLGRGEPSLSALESAWGGGQGGAGTPAHAGQRAAPRAEAAAEDWAAGKPYAAEAPAKPEIKVMAVSQLLLPASAAQASCDADGQALAQAAPNGEPWPARSGYVEGFPIGNKGGELQLTLDNANSAAPVFIRLFDLERRSNVRYLFIQAHEKFTVDQLTLGKYEVRYQRIEAGDAACAQAAK
ncbi:J domain-containing protein [Janthinobacterium fluminis]|uniref:J domain-containing protein n=1 Tax=Janthinobacterium fluminis TaxID=2987524 RepID=A0ABT5K665_9BURK|nr:J domain-containing protein [Janthinobacterium fluminis]MDC8760414.1 J domain-containing protein [Janthinobacterium fluminis]